MGYLYWNGSKIETPPCDSCGSTATTEEQELINPGISTKERKIYIKCYSCGYRKFVGNYEHLGNHNFKRI